MRSFSLLVPVVFATFALAQSPQSFNYQGVGRDAVGEPLNGQAIGVEFRLRSGSALGPVVYSETHGATTDMFGLFTLHVGEGAPGTGTFSAIDWSSGPYFLEIGLDLSASGVYTSFGTQQLLSVPYALHAGSSGDLPPGAEVGQIMHWDGGAWVADSGLYVHAKRFGIGIKQPEYPLSIKGEPGQDDQMISFHSSDESQKWNINLNPTGGDVDGFSIDDASSGLSQSRLFIADSSGHVGIGDTVPEAPLSIESRNILKTYFETGDIPTQDNFGISTDSAGFDIGQGAPNALQSRFFIQAATGHVGFGTFTPEEKLHIEKSTSGGVTGLKVLNTATVANQGFVMGHSHDPSSPRDGAFSLIEKTGTEFHERITVLSSGNVGINEVLPYAKLHVSRPASDPLSPVALAENTGILCLGPIEDNIVADHRGIQARHGEYAGGGSTLSLSTADLNLQRLGGQILVHGDAATDHEKVVITDDGRLGIGTVFPEERVVIETAYPNLLAGMKIRNTASQANTGWRIGHLNDAVPERDGAFLITSEGDSDWNDLVIRYNGNVGINEGIPDTKLHVSRPASDPLATLGLNEGTGIVTIGPITDNIVADYQGIQARHGEFIGPVLDLSTSTLNLQRLGGDILIHGDDVVESNRVTITSDGKIGVGKTAVEKLEINGAIVVGNTDNVAPSSGTIRWNSTTDDIEGFVGTAWTSLTSGGWEKVDNTDVIVASGDHPKVGIGTALPSAALHVSEDEATTGSSTGVVIENHATSSGTSAADTRIGLHISTSGQWSSNAGAKSAALVAMATPGGSSAAHANAAAVLGGNVVIGDLTGDQMVGTGGSNVLAIQNGTPPADGLSGGPGSNGAIQFYSADLSGVSTIHVMNGNGDVIKLYKEAPITPAQNLPVDGIYDPSEAMVIENMRTRITELENVLKALGLLTP